MTQRKSNARKLLVASVGVAVTAFSACNNNVVGNLMAVEAAPGPDSGSDANPFDDASFGDAAADAPADAGADGAADAGSD
jgi:hypothetical protein